MYVYTGLIMLPAMIWTSAFRTNPCIDQSRLSPLAWSLKPAVKDISRDAFDVINSLNL